jgi:hypothetical protein
LLFFIEELSYARGFVMRHMAMTVAVLCVSSLALAEVPHVMGYQGRVTDNSGIPVPDGDYIMRFHIYDNPSGSGSPLWDSGPHAVPVANGVFSVMLGEAPQPPLNLPFDYDYWMLVAFDGEDQLPLKPLGSVGYAWMASGLVPGTEVMGDVGYGTVFAATNTATSDPAQGLWGISWSSSGTGVYGLATAPTGQTNGVFGSSESQSGRGVLGFASAPAGTTYGVWGLAQSTDGRAVCGHAEATAGATYGVLGESASGDGTGVQGLASAASGYAVGVWGESSSTYGDGVHGRASATSGLAFGVYGESLSTDGKGVFGLASAVAGSTCGVWGKSTSSDGRGVLGVASTTWGWNAGVYGETSSTSGDGVHGMATATTGYAYGGYFRTASMSGRAAFGRALATTGTCYGVYGESASTEGVGVQGIATPTTRCWTTGVWGETLSSYGTGVVGWATASPGSMACGVAGHTNSVFGDGVAGYGGSYGTGVYGGCSGPGAEGVYGYNGSATGIAYGVIGSVGNPSGSSRVGVYYSGGLAGTGTKSCVVNTSQGPTMLYCQESPECWFEDFGEGRLLNGRAHVDLDPLFLETVTIDEANPMKVFVQLGGACEGVYVTRGRTGFDVVELRDGMSSVPFVYRVVAKRRDFEGPRLEVCEAARTDPCLHPELRSKQRRDYETRLSLIEQQHRRMEADRNDLKTRHGQVRAEARAATAVKTRS